jgi:hypothetical protein
MTSDGNNTAADQMQKHQHQHQRPNSSKPIMKSSFESDNGSKLISGNRPASPGTKLKTSSDIIYQKAAPIKGKPRLRSASPG